MPRLGIGKEEALTKSPQFIEIGLIVPTRKGYEHDQLIDVDKAVLAREEDPKSNNFFFQAKAQDKTRYDEKFGRRLYCGNLQSPVPATLIPWCLRI